MLLVLEYATRVKSGIVCCSVETGSIHHASYLIYKQCVILASEDVPISRRYYQVVTRCARSVPSDLGLVVCVITCMLTSFNLEFIG